MTNITPPHAGIELDVLDFSKATKLSVLRDEPKVVPDKNDAKNFIKSIYKKILGNDSFLSFSAQINDVNKILQMKYSSANDIANVILKDVALTTKLLKLVNSSFYGHFSKKGIQTVSEAMIILGTEEIKLAAASLKLYEFMQDIATVKVLKDKALKSLQRSLVARQIAKEEGINDAEAIQISAMLYDFGEYLVALFSPGVYIDIEILIDEKKLTRDQASKSITGVSYGALGRFIASKWKLPDSIILAMKPVENFDLAKTKMTNDNYLQYICSFSNDLCNIEVSMEGKSIGGKIVGISDKYDKCLQIEAPRAVDLLKMSLQNIKKHASILGVRVHPSN
ncbi:MAG: HDOD domain-containing protein [Desulfobacula sp.]|nr:HDOD domain-containing protein [Desulfobacula sp.]